MALEKIINALKKPVLVGAVLGCLYGGLGSWRHEKCVYNSLYLAGQDKRYSPTVSDYFFFPTYLTNCFLRESIPESGDFLDGTAPRYESYPINSAIWAGIGGSAVYGVKKIRKGVKEIRNKFKKK